MRIINSLTGMILFLVLLFGVGCGEESFQDKVLPEICPGAIPPVITPPDVIPPVVTSSGARLARVWTGGSTMASSRIAKEYVYDESGRISKMLCPSGTDVDSGLNGYVEFVYDERGYLSKEIEFSYNRDQTFHELSVLHYEYDEQGRKIKEIIEFPVAGGSEETHFFYKNDFLVRKIENDGQGQMRTYTDYEYDEAGQLVKETVHNPQTFETIRYSEHRNENGLNVETMIYTFLPYQEEFVELRKITKSYDLKGNLLQLVSKELAMFSSLSSFTEFYEYI